MAVMHDHGSSLPSEDAWRPAEEECAGTLVDLPCGCQDVVYACGYVDLEHDRMICPGAESTQVATATA